MVLTFDGAHGSGSWAGARYVAVFRWESQMAGRSRQLLKSVMAPVIDVLKDMNLDLDTVLALDGRRSAQISSSCIVLYADPLYYTLYDILMGYKTFVC